MSAKNSEILQNLSTEKYKFETEKVSLDTNTSSELSRLEQNEFEGTYQALLFDLQRLQNVVNPLYFMCKSLIAAFIQSEEEIKKEFGDDDEEDEDDELILVQAVQKAGGIEQYLAIQAIGKIKIFIDSHVKILCDLLKKPVITLIDIANITEVFLNDANRTVNFLKTEQDLPTEIKKILNKPEVQELHPSIISALDRREKLPKKCFDESVQIILNKLIAAMARLIDEDQRQKGKELSCYYEGEPAVLNQLLIEYNNHILLNFVLSNPGFIPLFVMYLKAVNTDFENGCLKRKRILELSKDRMDICISHNQALDIHAIINGGYCSTFINQGRQLTFLPSPRPNTTIINTNRVTYDDLLNPRITAEMSTLQIQEFEHPDAQFKINNEQVKLFRSFNRVSVLENGDQISKQIDDNYLMSAFSYLEQWAWSIMGPSHNEATYFEITIAKENTEGMAGVAHVMGVKLYPQGYCQFMDANSGIYFAKNYNDFLSWLSEYLPLYNYQNENSCCAVTMQLTLAQTKILNEGRHAILGKWMKMLTTAQLEIGNALWNDIITHQNHASSCDKFGQEMLAIMLYKAAWESYARLNHNDNLSVIERAAAVQSTCVHVETANKLMFERRRCLQSTLTHSSIALSLGLLHEALTPGSGRQDFQNFFTLFDLISYIFDNTFIKKVLEFKSLLTNRLTPPQDILGKAHVLLSESVHARPAVMADYINEINDRIGEILRVPLVDAIHQRLSATPLCNETKSNELVMGYLFGTAKRQVELPSPQLGLPLPPLELPTSNAMISTGVKGYRFAERF